MSSIVTDRGVVHYESHGRGKPVILLHCWLGSWGYWYPTMEFLGEHGYKTYALDFWGFGESAKTGSFTVSDYVEMVEQFTDRLGIERSPVMGHSMGGTVSLCLTLKHPKRVQKVAVVGSPIVGSGLSIFLQLAGRHFIARIVYNLPGALPIGVRLASPILARDWKTWYSIFERDLSRTTLESFLRSIESLRKTDLRPRLGEIRVPALGIYGAHDHIVSPRQGDLLEKVALSDVRRFRKSGHFPMLDETEAFNLALLDFLQH